MIRFLTFLLISSLLELPATAQTASSAPQPAAAPSATGPDNTAPQAFSADEVARRAVETLGGSEWEKARYIAFTFVVERDGKAVASFPQSWDRYTGQYRVSGRDQQGNAFEVLMNVNTKEGKAWLNGVPASDPKELLTLGYRRFINDTYWLLMPLKSLDPGVHREAMGQRSDCARTWDIVKLSFDSGVGLTSADQYWMYVNRDSGIVEEWDMKLQGSKPEDEPARVIFHDFRRVGGLLLSTRREVVGKNQLIRLSDLRVAAEVPADAFVR